MDKFNKRHTNVILAAGGVTLAIVLVIVVIVKWNQLKAWVQKIADKTSLDKEIISEDVTFSANQTKTMAAKLYVAMKGWGTDEEAIYSVMRSLQTRSDLLSVIKQYRADYNESLSERLCSELTNRELKKVNTILSEKGIDYTF